MNNQITWISAFVGYVLGSTLSNVIITLLFSHGPQPNPKLGELNACPPSSLVLQNLSNFTPFWYQERQWMLSSEAFAGGGIQPDSTRTVRFELAAYEAATQSLSCQYQTYNSAKQQDGNFLVRLELPYDTNIILPSTNWSSGSGNDMICSSQQEADCQVQLTSAFTEGK